MRHEFGDHKYRNGHSSPLKDAGERRISGGTAFADRRLLGVIGKKVVDRASRFRVYELVGESIKNTRLPSKSYFAFLFNKTAEERTETVRHCDKHSQPSATHCGYILLRLVRCVKSNLLWMD